MPAMRRTLKNVVKNYSDAQVKVREATSNDPWGPSSTLMSEIADLTYNVMAFTEIMQMIWKRLNDDGKNWRHVYKSLVVLDYIIKTGSEKVAQQCKENFHAIKTLTSFQYTDADNKDQGMNVREKAKILVTMLSDDERLKNERAKAMKAKERFAQNAMGVGSSGTTGARKARLGESPTSAGGYREASGGYNDSQEQGTVVMRGGANGQDASPGSLSAGSPSEMESARPSSAGEEELQLQLALAMSKEEHDESLRYAKSDDIKLQMALEQSRETQKTERRHHHHIGSTPDGPVRQNSTLLDIAGTSSSGGAPASDPWGLTAPPSATPPTDPWGAPLPPAPVAAPPDPWGSSGAAASAFSPVQSQQAPQAQSAQPHTGAWSSSTSPMPATWGPSPAMPPHSSPPPAYDAFGAPMTHVANGTSGGNPIDNEFDMLSSRVNDPSPSKPSGVGFDEFDLLSGGPTTNGSSGNAFDMSGLGDDLMGNNKPKKAEDFLGANANLVNLDQLVAKAPPKAANNPFAMATGASNPFQDPSAAQRTPMSMMAPPTQIGAPAGFSQPVSSGLLPQPLLPLGNQPQAMQPQQQQSYNPFL